LRIFKKGTMTKFDAEIWGYEHYLRVDWIDFFLQTFLNCIFSILISWSDFTPWSVWLKIRIGDVHILRNAIFQDFRPPSSLVTKNHTNPYVLTMVRNKLLWTSPYVIYQDSLFFQVLNILNIVETGRLTSLFKRGSEICDVIWACEFQNDVINLELCKDRLILIQSMSTLKCFCETWKINGITFFAN
jgi:hypothetical protein